MHRCGAEIPGSRGRAAHPTEAPRPRRRHTDELIRHRFNVYRERTAPLMRCYRKEFITIDGVGAIDGVFTPDAMSLRRLPPIRHQQGVSREGDLCNARRQHRRPEYNPQSNDVYRQADRPTPHRHLPRPPSLAWDGTTRPLRVGVVGADPNRSWANGTLTHTWPNRITREKLCPPSRHGRLSPRLISGVASCPGAQ